jgi:hypothetical protein
MRSAPATTLASNTASHDSFFALKRAMNVSKTEQNQLPKVGVMSSSQRTGLQVASFANRRTQFQKGNGNDVKSALAKVRGGGCVAPKKKGAPKN